MKKIFAITLVILLVVAPVNKARATALVPIITDAALTQIENAAIGEYIYYLLSSGVDLSFQGFVDGTIDTFKDILHLSTTNSTISDFVDDFIDEYTGETERIIKPVKNDRHLVRKIRNEFTSNSPDSEVFQPITLTDYQKEVLAGAYNIKNQTLYTPSFYTNTSHGYTINSEVSYDRLNSLYVTNSNNFTVYSYWVENTSNIKYFINLNDFSVSLYNSDFTVNLSGNLAETYHEGPYGYYQTPRFEGADTYDNSTLIVHKNLCRSGGHSYESSFSLLQEGFWNHSYYIGGNITKPVRNLTNALYSLWGSKNTDIYVGYSLSGRMKLENPIVSSYSFGGGFIANNNYQVPMVINYPQGSSIDYTGVFEALISAINSKSTLSFSDIEDLIVDVNGQKAVASYVVATYDLDTELKEQYSVLVEYDENQYTLAFAENIENGGVIISETTNILPDELWVVLIGSAIFSLICLLWSRMLK